MKAVAYLVAAAVLAAAAPASAVQFVMDLSVGGSNSGSGNGNVRTYTSTVGAQTLTLQASAWTNALNTTPFPTTLKSFLGTYSGGLGVTSPGEDGSANTHTVDNVTREDFILLKFNRAVDLTSMFLSVYNIGTGGPDSDARVFYRYGAAAPTNNGLSSTYFSQFSFIDIAGTGTSGARDVPGVNFSDTWLVSAAVGQNGAANDGFKLKSLTAAIPEPSTWAMMIIGFGAAGASLRARRRVAVTA